MPCYLVCKDGWLTLKTFNRSQWCLGHKLSWTDTKRMQIHEVAFTCTKNYFKRFFHLFSSQNISRNLGDTFDWTLCELVNVLVLGCSPLNPVCNQPLLFLFGNSEPNLSHFFWCSSKTFTLIFQPFTHISCHKFRVGCFWYHKDNIKCLW